MFKCNFFSKVFKQVDSINENTASYNSTNNHLYHKTSVYNVWVCSGFLLCSVNLLVHPMPIPYGIYYYSFVIGTWYNNFPALFSFYKISTLYFHTHFWSTCHFHKLFSWNTQLGLYWTYRDEFWKNSHPDSIESTNHE